MKTYTWIIIAFILIILGVVLLTKPNHGHAQATSVTLDWTATGDDGVVGTASEYKIRYSNVRPDTTDMLSWWNTATVVQNVPAPKISGSQETFTINSTFITGTTYYFVLQTCDEVPNCSSFSNIAEKFIPDTLPPARVLDLRTR